MRNLFAEEACEFDIIERDGSELMKEEFLRETVGVFTTWSGGVPVDEFIQIS